MKFTVKHEFKAKGRVFEEKNTHNSDNLPDVTDGDVMRWRTAGWVDVDGEESGPDPVTGHAELEVDNLKLGHKVEDVNNG